MKKVYFLVGLLSTQLFFSQDKETFPFQEEVQNYNLPAFYGGSMVDGIVDDKPSLLITGMINNQPTTVLYQYNGTTFEKNPSLFTGVRGGQGIFLDVDKDGDQDIAIIGLGGDHQRYFRIYENNAGAFTLKQDLPNYALSSSSIDAADYNKDGFPDIIITGQKNNDPNSKQTYLFVNNHGNLEQTTAPFSKITQGTAKFIDLKGDGNLGVVLSGKIDDYGTVEVYAQTNGNFKRIRNYYNSDYGYENVDIAVAKIDPNDNLADFVPIGKGYQDDGYIFYGTNESSTIDFNPGYNLPNFIGSESKNTVLLKDFNKDGYPELVILGNFVGADADSSMLHYYYNDAYEDLKEVTTPSVKLDEGSIATLDFNNDGYMDLIVAGKDNGGNSHIKVFKNTLSTLSTKEISTAQTISIYPNPTSESFKIKTSEKLSQVEVYGMTGRLIKTFAPAEQYNISSLEKGTYIVVIKDLKGKSSTLKLLKK